MEGLPWVRSPGWHFVSDSNLLCVAAVSLLLLVRTTFHWQTFYPQRKEYRSISSSSCFSYRFSIVYGWLTRSEHLLTHHTVTEYVKALSGWIEQETNGRHPALTACGFPGHQEITSVCLSWPLEDHFYTLLKRHDRFSIKCN